MNTTKRPISKIESVLFQTAVALTFAVTVILVWHADGEAVMSASTLVPAGIAAVVGFIVASLYIKRWGSPFSR
jgi:hypothetical protein